MNTRKFFARWCRFLKKKKNSGKRLIQHATFAKNRNQSAVIIAPAFDASEQIEHQPA
jgi:hypothetical protein